MSLFVDTLVEFVTLTLTKKDASTTVSYSLGVDYYPADSLYTGSPIIYPVLVAPPVVARVAGEQIALRQEAAIQAYGKSHLSKYGYSLLDVLNDYEFMNGSATSYFIPKTDTSTITFTAADHTRAVLEIYDYRYDESSGVLTLQTRDTWLKDREITRKLDSDLFPTIEEAWDGEYGATTFGQPATDSVAAIPAPFIESGIDGSNRPNAKIFTGWTAPNHPLKDYPQIYVRNQYPDIEAEEWHQAYFVSDPQLSFAGDSDLTDLGSVSETLLTRYSYGRTFAYEEDPFILPPYFATVLTAVRAKIPGIEHYWAAVSSGITNSKLTNGKIYEKLTLSNTWCGDVFIYLASTATTQTILSRERDGTERVWALYYDSSASRFKFVAYNNASGVYSTATASTFGAPSAGNWYHIAFGFNDSSLVGTIDVNNTGIDTSGAGSGTRSSSRAGLRLFGRGQNDQKFTGRISMLHFFEESLTTTRVGNMYNSGDGKFSWEMTENDQDNAIAIYDLTETSGIRKDSAGSYDLGQSGGNVGASPHFREEALTANDGELTLVISEAQYDTTADRWKPVRELRTSSIDHMASGVIAGTTVPFFQLDPPFVISPYTRYFAEIRWSGRSPYGRGMRINYEVSGGSYIYRKNHEASRELSEGWERLDDFKLDMEFFVLGYGDDDVVFGTASGSPRYSYNHLEAKSITLTSSQEHLEFNKGIEFKALIQSALEDDGSGTYTGTANAVIKNPADLVHFAVRNADLGAGVASGSLNTSSFASVRSLVSAFGTNTFAALEEFTSVRDFIQKICRQFRMRFYKQRDGKLALNWPTSFTVASVNLSEAIMRAELQLLESTLDDESNVINDLSLNYARDGLNAPKDRAFLRKAGTDKFSGLVVQGATTSTDADSTREDKCALSQSLYGKREMKEALDFIDTETEALKVKGYLTDRYYKRRERKQIRVPRKRYYSNLDLFSTVQIQHTAIPAQGGSTWTIKATDAGQPVTLYFEGTPVTLWAGGTFKGEVIAVQEEGAFLTLTVEEVPSLPG